MKKTMIYQDPTQPVDVRVNDLLSRMTTEEKVGQLVQLDGRVEIEKMYNEQHPASFLQIIADDCKKPIEMATASRLGIPVLLGVDAIHGHSFWEGATIFPTQLGIASSWNESLIESMASITAKEMRNTGVAWTFSPVLCIARDLRWGRVGETFGEDPMLIGRFAAAMIYGYQGKDLSNPDKVLACAKHYAGYSETQGGRDASEADLTIRKLKSYFLPPFKKAVEAGVGSFMTGYQSIDGLPSTANQWLLRTNLKEDWGFEGFLVTDWFNVGYMVTAQKICPDYKHAAALAVQAGNDMMMSVPNFYQGCLDALKEGMLDEKLVDEACKRVLRIKFKLGLFEDPRKPDVAAANRVTGAPEHRRAALQAARESAVLLANNGILPLAENNVKKLALIGPNADDVLALCGDWSRGTGQAGINKPHPRQCYVTALDGLRARFKGELLYAKGCGIEKDEPADLGAAIDAVKSADVSVVVVGDRLPFWGEFKSTATLELQGGQRAMLDAVVATGKPYIIVVVSSKPLILPEAARNNAAAIIQQFSPGMLGGQALAEILFGDINPGGRLTISIPYHVGQQPIYYQQVRGQHGSHYADLTQDPLYAFGYGLTYTTFDYVEAKLNKKTFSAGEDIKVKVTVKNTGSRPGLEIVQAYVSDLVTSATWVDQELKGFARVELQSGESKKVEIIIPVSECSIVNRACERVVEPGDFEIRIGKSARDIQKVLPFNVK